MVFPGEDDYTATEPDPWKALHRFMSLKLKWGIQRHMKCIKVDSANGSYGSGASGDNQHNRRSSTLEFATSSVAIQVRSGEANNQSVPLRNLPSKSVEKGSKEELNQSSEKIMLDTKIARDKSTEPMFTITAVEDQEKDERSEEVKPWNLRRRKASCKEPIEAIHENQFKEPRAVNDNQFNVPIGASNENQCEEFRKEVRIVTRKRGRGVTADAERKERSKFSMQLSRKEIEEDYIALMGRRPQSRPKKRPRTRTVQKLVHNLFPGLNLTEVTPDLYKVPENPQRR